MRQITLNEALAMQGNGYEINVLIPNKDVWALSTLTTLSRFLRDVMFFTDEPEQQMEPEIEIEPENEVDLEVEPEIGVIVDQAESGSTEKTDEEKLPDAIFGDDQEEQKKSGGGEM